jgi:hypothetical protein
VGKKDILLATVIRKRTTIVSLEGRTIREQDALEEEHQDEHSELSRCLTTPSPAFSPIQSHLEAQNK